MERSSVLSRQQLQAAIARFARGRLLVVGDVAIDEMVYGRTERLSREAPVVILNHQRTDIVLGAAGNAAHNIAALGASQTVMAGVLGTDYYASLLLDALQRDGVQADALVSDSQRPTTTKTRISGMANHSVTQQIVRVDRESRQPLRPEIEQALQQHIATFLPTMDAVILSDYALGVMTPAIIQCCQQAKRSRYPSLVLSVDSQQPLSLFQGATILTPNQPEAERNLGYALDSREALLGGGLTLLEQTQAENLLITRGQDGMALFERLPQQNMARVTEIPVFNRSEVFDVTGAGDTVIATLTLALATGSSVLEATVLGNLAASLVVKRFGAAVTSVQELTDTLNGLDEAVFHHIRQEVLALPLQPLSPVVPSLQPVPASEV
ncbi:MAG: bifunctional ADP-heptose synthase [Candidatus Melainabacteria bacterium]|nr:bifunctional ADP-heptose synthase [Candidatus Melainabacteria bacterium]